MTPQGPILLFFFLNTFWTPLFLSYFYYLGPMGPQILSPGDDHLERRPPREGLFARCRRCRGLEGLEGFANVEMPKALPMATTHMGPPGVIDISMQGGGMVRYLGALGVRKSTPGAPRGYEKVSLWPHDPWGTPGESWFLGDSGGPKGLHGPRGNPRDPGVPWGRWWWL